MPHDPPARCDEQPPPDGPPNGVSRREFMQTLGISAAAGAVATSGEARAGQEQAGDGPGDAPILGPGPVPLRLHINGAPVEVEVEPATTLLDALRLHLDLTGTKEICDRGACGGCSVLVDGKLIASCMMLAVDAAGSRITTVEGLASADGLDRLQRAFIKHDALQCGYCTPGLLVASRALLDANPKPSLAEIKRGLSGNLCRCGTYTNVFNAVLEASGQPVVTDAGGA